MNISQYMLVDHCVAGAGTGGALVYWAAGSAIFKLAPGGSPAYAVTTAATSATAIAIDDKYLYWADQSFIGRVPK